jgi:hypothetical protein
MKEAPANTEQLITKGAEPEHLRSERVAGVARLVSFYALMVIEVVVWMDHDWHHSSELYLATAGSNKQGCRRASGIRSS